MGTALEGHLAAGRHARAFDLIVPEYRDRVFRLACSILRDRAAAEDDTLPPLRKADDAPRRPRLRVPGRQGR